MDPSFRRVIVIFAVAMAMGYLIFSGVFSRAAPLGGWQNQIFGQTAWSEWDPGGSYVDAAHQLTWGERPLFVGHPGTVLVLLLSSLQHVYFTVVGLDTGFSFTEFTARNLPTVFLLSKLMMTVLHLVACFVVYRLARRVLQDERAAAFSALGYATSLPVGYFLSRISVEPLVVIFFALSLLSLWRYQDFAAQNRLAEALRFAALAGVLSVSGLVTKLNFLAPLVPFLALYLSFQGRGDADSAPISRRTRLLGLLAFASTASLSLLLYSQFIDWQDFFGIWRTIAGLKSTAWSLTHFLPGLSPGRIFPLSEFVFVALGVFGLIAFLRANAGRRSRALWLSAFGLWSLLLFAFRIAKSADFLPFHYFNLSNVVVAVFFGHAIMLLLRRLRPAGLGSTKAVSGILMVLLLHGMAFWTVFDSRYQDTLRYAPSKEIHRAIAKLEPGQRFGCIQCRPLMDTRQRRLFPKWFFLTSTGWTVRRNPAYHSRLTAEFESIFVSYDPGSTDVLENAISLPALMGKVVVIDESDAILSPQAESHL